MRRKFVAQKLYIVNFVLFIGPHKTHRDGWLFSTKEADTKMINLSIRTLFYPDQQP